MKITLRALRTNYGMTQEQAAKALGISRFAFQSYEIGRTLPNVKTGLKISKLFNVDLHDILFSSKMSLNDR